MSTEFADTRFLIGEEDDAIQKHIAKVVELPTLKEKDWHPRFGYKMLTGKKVFLRRIVESDMDFIYALFKDPDVVWSILDDIDTVNIAEWIYTKHPSSDRSLAWIAERMSDGANIGVVTLEDVHFRYRRAGPWGLFIDKKYRKQRIGLDAEMTMLRYAFDYLNLNRVWSFMRDGSQGTERLLADKIPHLTFEGTQKQVYYFRGHWVDQHLVAVFAGDDKWKEYWEKDDD